MKKILLFLIATTLFIGCKQETKRYTQQSPEIDTVKKLIANYNAKTYDMSVYVDSSKTNYNSKEISFTPAEALAYHQTNDANYSDRGFLTKDQEYEMVLTDDGETWVNCWLDWKGTMAGNGKVINMPVHLTYQFIDGKIVREVGMWDSSPIVMNLQAIEAAKNLAVEE